MAQSAAPYRSTRPCRSNRSCYFLAPFGYVVGWIARKGPARHLGLDLCATDRSRRHLIMQIISLVNYLDSSKKSCRFLSPTWKDRFKKCEKTLVHRKPSVKRLECYVWRFAKAFGEAITKKKGHKVAGGQATLWSQKQRLILTQRLASPWKATR